MPLGGTNILWNEAAPADSDSAGAGAAEIRSDKTSIRNAMGSEHFWLSGGGAATGYHLLGSARAFVDVQSNVSSSGTDGRLLVTSDTSKLFHVGSGGTMFLGGQTAISAGSSPVGGQRFYWVAEFGDGITNSSGLATIAFPNSGYSGKPFIYLTVERSSGQFNAQVNTVNGTTLGVSGWASGSLQSGVSFNWLSLGTRTF